MRPLRILIWILGLASAVFTLKEFLKKEAPWDEYRSALHKIAYGDEEDE